jgi:hypothetical protein
VRIHCFNTETNAVIIAYVAVQYHFKECTNKKEQYTQRLYCAAGAAPLITISKQQQLILSQAGASHWHAQQLQQLHSGHLDNILAPRESSINMEIYDDAWELDMHIYAN